MGKEEIIYGDRHGALDRVEKVSPSGLTGETREETYWPHAIRVHAAYGGYPAVELQVFGFDQETGAKNFEESMLVELNRNGCNRLIKALRKYRNEVFGADE